MKAALVLIAAIVAQAGLAQNLPNIGYVYPAGGQQGSKFQVRIGGQSLGGATNVYFSQGGVEAEIGEYSRPMTQREFNELRTQLEELRKRREAAGKAGAAARRKKGNVPTGWTAADERMLNQLRQKIASFQRRPLNPAIAETLTLTVTIAPDAAPGTRELRMRTGTGLSNPLVFKVGQLPEVAHKPAQPVEDPSQRPRFARAAATAPAEKPETRLTLPAVANGQIMPGEVDRFKFRARAGQKVVLALNARELIPYLPDAVPGWFQATLTVYDLKGNELAYADDFRFHPDPVLFFEPAKDGDYIAEIKDSIYRGREDFVYRLTIGELPFLTGIYPLGGLVGNAAEVEASGWNLPGKRISVEAASQQGIQLISLKGDAASNPLPFARENLRETAEREPNDTASQAQQVEVPLVINGRIGVAGESDVFKFSGKAGMELVAEVTARRLSSPLDSLLRLTDAAGTQIAINDDCEDRGAGLATHHADSRLAIKLPKDGAYLLHLSDAQGKGGAEYGYRLRISEPQPDFELRVVPSSVTVRPGGSAPVTVYALRKDGFTGDIRLALEDDHGFVLGGARIPAGVDKIPVTLSAPAEAMAEPVSLRIEGRAVVDGKILTRPAVPAEDMMQAFFYRHLVPSKELLVCVNGGWAQRWPVRVASELPVKIPAGGVGSVRITAPRNALSRARLELSDAPEGISIKNVESSVTGAEIVLTCDPEKARPGSRGNLILQPSLARPQGNRAAAGGNQFNPFGCLPAIPYEIVAQ